MFTDQFGTTQGSRPINRFKFVVTTAVDALLHGQTLPPISLTTLTHLDICTFYDSGKMALFQEKNYGSSEMGHVGFVIGGWR